MWYTYIRGDNYDVTNYWNCIFCILFFICIFWIGNGTLYLRQKWREIIF
nr:MAG TPA: protein of unknown function (DUF4122) [Caudoviricetes sp.]